MYTQHRSPLADSCTTHNTPLSPNSLPPRPQLIAWKHRIVTLRYKSTGRCVYTRSAKREIESEEYGGPLSHTKQVKV